MNHKLKQTFSKSVSTFLLIAFSITTPTGQSSLLIAATEAPRSSADISLDSLPSEIGTIKELHSGDAGQPFVIHIQTAHANPSAQTSIRKILRWVDENRRSPSLQIGLEGTVGRLHPEYFDIAPHTPEVGDAVIDDLHKKGELTGAELFAWDMYQRSKVEGGRSKDQFVGIETADLYRENLKNYRQHLLKDKEIATLLQGMRRDLEVLKSKHLSPALLDFYRERDRRKNGRYTDENDAEALPQLEVYLQYLAGQIKSTLEIDLADPIEQIRYPHYTRILTLGRLQKEIKVEQAAKEEQVVLKTVKAKARTLEAKKLAAQLTSIRTLRMPRKTVEKLWAFAADYRIDLKAYPEYLKTLGQTILHSEISSEGLFAEIDELESYLLDSLAKSEKEKEIIKQIHEFSLLEKLMTLKLTRAEFATLTNHKQLYSNPLYQSAIHFYKTAILRDEALLSNFSATISPDTTNVLVAGGFHTHGLLELMREKGMGYAVIQPRIQEAPQSLYRDVFLDRHAELDASINKASLNKQAALILKAILSSSFTGDIKTQMIQQNPVLAGHPGIQAVEDTLLFTEVNQYAFLRPENFLAPISTLRAESRTDLETKRAEFLRELSIYYESLAQGDDFTQNKPDIFLLLGNPDLTTFLEFAKRWKSEFQGTPIVLAGGRGRGTVPLIQKTLSHYDGHMPPKTKVTLSLGLDDDQIYETDVLRMILEQEGVLKPVHIEAKPSSTTRENFVNSLPVIQYLTRHKRNPSVAIVTNPPLLKRVQIMAKKTSEEVRFFKFRTHRVDLDALSAQELIDLTTYLAGHPDQYTAQYPELANWKDRSELNGIQDQLGVPRDYSAGQKLQEVFADYLNALGVTFDAEQKKLIAPRSEAREGFAVTSGELRIGSLLIRIPQDANVTRVSSAEVVLHRNAQSLNIKHVKRGPETYLIIGHAAYQVVVQPDSEGQRNVDIFDLNPLGNQAWFQFFGVAPSIAASKYDFPLPTDDLKKGEALRLFPASPMLYPSLSAPALSSDEVKNRRAFLFQANQAGEQALLKDVYQILHNLIIMGTRATPEDYDSAQDVLMDMLASDLFRKYHSLIAEVSNYILLVYNGAEWEKWQRMKREVLEKKQSSSSEGNKPKRALTLFERPVEAVRLPVPSEELKDWEIVSVKAVEESSEGVTLMQGDAESSVFRLGQEAIQSGSVLSYVFAGGSATTVKKVMGRNKLVHPAYLVKTNHADRQQMWISALEGRNGLLIGQNEKATIDIVTSVGGARENESDKDVRQLLEKDVYQERVRSGKMGIVRQRSGFILDSESGNAMRYSDGLVALVAENHLWAFAALLLSKSRVIDHLKHENDIVIAGNGDNILNFPRPEMVGRIREARQQGEAVASVAVTTPAVGDKKGGIAVDVTYRNSVTGQEMTQREFREVSEFPTATQGSDAFGGIQAEEEFLEKARKNGWLIEQIFEAANHKPLFNVAFYGIDLRLIIARLFGLDETSNDLVDQLEKIDTQEWIDQIHEILDQVPKTRQPAKKAPSENGKEEPKGVMTEQTVQDLIVNGGGLLRSRHGRPDPVPAIVAADRKDIFLPYKGTSQRPLTETGEEDLSLPEVYDLVANQRRAKGAIKELLAKGHRVVLENGVYVSEMIPADLETIKNAVKSQRKLPQTPFWSPEEVPVSLRARRNAQQLGLHIDDVVSSMKNNYPESFYDYSNYGVALGAGHVPQPQLETGLLPLITAVNAVTQGKADLIFDLDNAHITVAALLRSQKVPINEQDLKTMRWDVLLEAVSKLKGLYVQFDQLLFSSREGGDIVLAGYTHNLDLKNLQKTLSEAGFPLKWDAPSAGESRSKVYMRIGRLEPEIIDSLTEKEAKDLANVLREGIKPFEVDYEYLKIISYNNRILKSVVAPDIFLLMGDRTNLTSESVLQKLIQGFASAAPPKNGRPETRINLQIQPSPNFYVIAKSPDIKDYLDRNLPGPDAKKIRYFETYDDAMRLFKSWRDREQANMLKAQKPVLEGDILIVTLEQGTLNDGMIFAHDFRKQIDPQNKTAVILLNRTFDTSPQVFKSQKNLVFYDNFSFFTDFPDDLFVLKRHVTDRATGIMYGASEGVTGLNQSLSHLFKQSGPSNSDLPILNLKPMEVDEVERILTSYDENQQPVRLHLSTVLQGSLYRGTIEGAIDDMERRNGYIRVSFKELMGSNDLEPLIKNNTIVVSASGDNGKFVVHLIEYATRAESRGVKEGVPDLADAWPAHAPEKIAVVGTGFVGITKSILMATDWGHDVVGIDVVASKVDALNAGHLTNFIPGLEELLHEALDSKRLRFTTDYEEGLEGRRIVFLALPTPQSETGEADIHFLQDAVRKIAQILKEGETKIIVTKSTAPPMLQRALKDIARQEMARRGLTGKSFLKFATEPEFLREGSELYDDRVGAGRRVIAADDAKIREELKALYNPDHRNPNFEIAELPILEMQLTSGPLVKYAANGYRALKISFINYIGWFADALGFDIEDIANQIGQDPRIIRSFLNCGIGFGGSCFPKDLAAAVRMFDDAQAPYDLLLDSLAINEYQWRSFVSRILDKLDSVKDKNIVVLGGSFKAGTDDVRESRAILITRELLDLGANVSIYDPKSFAPLKTVFANDPAVQILETRQEMDQQLQNSQAIILATEWDEFKRIDFDDLRKHFVGKPLPVIFDGRNFLNPKVLEALGYSYSGIGRGLNKRNQFVDEKEFILNVKELFLALRISYVNQLAQVADALDANIHDVVLGLGKDPVVGADYLRPSIGFGGHHLPKALTYFNRLATNYLSSEIEDYREIRSGLLTKFKTHGVSESKELIRNPFTTAIADINEQQIPLYIKKAASALGGHLQGRTIAVLGLSFKPGTYSIQNTPAIPLIEELLASGAKVIATDVSEQTISNARRTPRLSKNSNLEFMPSALDAVANSDLAILVTPHEAYDQAFFRDMANFLVSLKLVDGTHAFDPEEMREHGIYYSTVGIRTIVPQQRAENRSEIRGVSPFSSVFPNLSTSSKTLTLKRFLQSYLEDAQVKQHLTPAILQAARTSSNYFQLHELLSKAPQSLAGSLAKAILIPNAFAEEENNPIKELALQHFDPEWIEAATKPSAVSIHPVVPIDDRNIENLPEEVLAYLAFAGSDDPITFILKVSEEKAAALKTQFEEQFPLSETMKKNLQVVGIGKEGDLAKATQKLIEKDKDRVVGILGTDGAFLDRFNVLKRRPQSLVNDLPKQQTAFMLVGEPLRNAVPDTFLTRLSQYADQRGYSNMAEQMAAFIAAVRHISTQA